MKNEYKLKQYIIDACNAQHFSDFTPIQKRVIEEYKLGKNIMGKSKTGSGKTLAFLVPIFQTLNEQKQETQAIVISPTRELALQIANVANQIASFCPDKITIRTYIGGTDRQREKEKLEHIQPQIVIATPGRLSDFVAVDSSLIVTQVKNLVIDEADMTFEDGFLEDIMRIVPKCPNARIMVFSATLPEQIKAFMKRVSDHKEYVLVETDSFQTLNIQHMFIKLKHGEDKKEALYTLIQTLNPYICLIFANTKKRVEEVHDFLKKKGIDSLELHGDLDARKRRKNILMANDLKYTYIVCSDIAARGIDIDGVSTIINYDLPSDMEFYLHRSGRTGRGVYSGECYSLYDFDNRDYINYLEHRGVKIEYKKLTDGQVVDYRDKVRSLRERPLRDSEKKAHVMIKKSSVVKPGYKKKRMEEIEKLSKKINREEKHKSRYRY